MSIAPSGDRPSKKRTFDDSIEALIDGFPSKRRKILQDVTPYLTAQHQRPQINDQTAAPNVDHNRSISRPELSRKRPRSAEEEDDYSPTNRREGHHKKAKHDHAPSVPPIPQPNTQNHACAGDSVPDLSHHDREHEGRPDADREHSTDNRTTAQESHTNREGSERDLSDHQNQPETSLEESRSNRPQASGETSLIEPLGHGRVPPLVIPCEAGIHGDEPNDDAGIDNVEVEQATRCILQALYDAVAWFCRECGINANARATLCDNRTERQNYFYGKCLGEKPIEAASQCDLLVSMLGGCIEELIFRDKVFVSEVEGDVHLKRELEALKEHMGAQNSDLDVDDLLARVAFRRITSPTWKNTVASDRANSYAHECIEILRPHLLEMTSGDAAAVLAFEQKLHGAFKLVVELRARLQIAPGEYKTFWPEHGQCQSHPSEEMIDTSVVQDDNADLRAMTKLVLFPGLRLETVFNTVEIAAKALVVKKRYPVRVGFPEKHNPGRSPSSRTGHQSRARTTTLQSDVEAPEQDDDDRSSGSSSSGSSRVNPLPLSFRCSRGRPAQPKARIEDWLLKVAEYRQFEPGMTYHHLLPHVPGYDVSCVGASLKHTWDKLYKPLDFMPETSQNLRRADLKQIEHNMGQSPHKIALAEHVMRQQFAHPEGGDTLSHESETDRRRNDSTDDEQDVQATLLQPVTTESGRPQQDNQIPTLHATESPTATAPGMPYSPSATSRPRVGFRFQSRAWASRLQDRDDPHRRIRNLAYSSGLQSYDDYPTLDY